MGLDACKDAKQRLAKNYEDIKEHLLAALGPRIDLDDEAKTVIEFWRTDGSHASLGEPLTPLQALLQERSKIQHSQFWAANYLASEVALDIRQQVREAVSEAAEVDDYTRDLVISSLFQELIFETPLLPWLERQEGWLSVKLSVVLQEWINNPEWTC
jgi:hypothetical protein